MRMAHIVTVQVKTVKASLPRLIITMTPGIAKLVEQSKQQRQASRNLMKKSSFYSKALGKLLWAIDWHSSVNHSKIALTRMVKEQPKAVHPFPCIDRSLPVVGWNAPLQKTDNVQMDQLAEYEKRRKDLDEGDSSDLYNMSAAKELLLGAYLGYKLIYGFTTRTRMKRWVVRDSGD